MATIEEQIKELEEQISKTKYNKATEGHIGKLKAKIARLNEEEEKRRASKGGNTKGFYVKKAGNATVALVGFPSVGKSTLLNQLTGAKSEVGAYHSPPSTSSLESWSTTMPRSRSWICPD